ASVGIAMGGASSAQAMETADVVLMGDDLRQLPYAFRLADFTQRVMVQNIALSLATKLIFIVLALSGAATLWMAVLADMGVSLLVTFNGMRPLAFERTA
ncbi:MAG: heavy metal translocating P-type ATPase, partial [Bellilinea sp.]